MAKYYHRLNIFIQKKRIVRGIEHNKTHSTCSSYYTCITLVGIPATCVICKPRTPGVLEMTRTIWEGRPGWPVSSIRPKRLVPNNKPASMVGD